jgi:hypothetical protein
VSVTSLKQEVKDVSWLARGVLFVSSYAPLLFLFAILESFGPGWPSRVCGIVGARVSPRWD